MFTAMADKMVEVMEMAKSETVIPVTPLDPGIIEMAMVRVETFLV